MYIVRTRAPRNRIRRDRPYTARSWHLRDAFDIRRQTPNARINIINSSGGGSARGELRASTVRKPRAAPGAHVALLSASALLRFCFQRVPSGRRLGSCNTRCSIPHRECAKRHARETVKRENTWLFEAYLSQRNPTRGLRLSFFFHK